MRLNAITSSTLFALVMVIPVRADVGGCTEPTPPPPLRPSDTMTQNELSSGISAAEAFIDRSNEYRACLKEVIEAEKTKEGGASPDRSIVAALSAKIAASERQEEEVTANIDAAISAY